MDATGDDNDDDDDDGEINPLWSKVSSSSNSSVSPVTISISISHHKSVPHCDPSTDASRRNTTLYICNSRNDESADAIINRSLDKGNEISKCKRIGFRPVDLHYLYIIKMTYIHSY